jgi:hypothetical protein
MSPSHPHHCTTSSWPSPARLQTWTLTSSARPVSRGTITTLLAKSGGERRDSGRGVTWWQEERSLLHQEEWKMTRISRAFLGKSSLWVRVLWIGSRVGLGRKLMEMQIYIHKDISKNADLFIPNPQIPKAVLRKEHKSGCIYWERGSRSVDTCFIEIKLLFF